MSLLIRSAIQVVLFTLLLIALSGCMVTPVPPTVTPIPATEPVDDFANVLLLAVINRDYDQLQSMMGDPFTFGFWLSEGTIESPADAVEQFRVNYLGSADAVSFDTSTDLTNLLGRDPLTMWGPGVNTVAARYLTGLAADGMTEAILIIAQRDDGTPYWYSALIAPTGFRLPPQPSTPAPVVPPQRIRFEPGATSATLTGQLSAPNRKDYILQARAGQSIQVSVESPDGSTLFGIASVEGQLIKRPDYQAPSWSFIVPRSIDYIITLSQPVGTSSYSLFIEILPGEEQPERVQFGAGETSATRNGILATGGDIKQYVLNAVAGQVMEIISSGETIPVNFTITGPDGTQWVGAVMALGEMISVKTVTLPQSGDYLVTLTTPDGSPETDYDIAFVVVTPANRGALPERVHFASGSTRATQSGALTPGGVKQYVLNAAARQTMHVRAVGSGAPVSFVIESPGGSTYPAEPLATEAWVFEKTILLPESGDYLVTLSTSNDADPTLYDISFSIEGETAVPEPERVNFAPGATSATLSGDITWPGRKRYLLRAAAGQTLHAIIGSPDGLANFAIQGMDDGQPYKRLENEARAFSFVLPHTQDYMFTVARPEGSGSYSLVIEIPPPAAPAPAERVRFAADTTSATREGVIPAGVNVKRYVLGAAAGQTMRVVVTAETVPIDILVTSTGTGGPLLSSGAVTLANSLTVVLPTTTDYLVELTTPLAAPDANYTALFEIE